jgi:hypothetical protein
LDSRAPEVIIITEALIIKARTGKNNGTLAVPGFNSL